MADHTRQCATCQFFQQSQLAGNGWCTHPKRQVASDVKILVRQRELACRNSWGDDLWQSTSSPATTPAQGPHRGLVIHASGTDDEVTHVTPSASAQPTSPTVSDDVVTHTSVRSDERSRPADRIYDHNAGAIADQDERARVMARGSRDAILSARQRHSQRRGTPRTTIEPESSSSATTTGAATPAASPASPIATPPVPREEVASRNQQVSPAQGPDQRFDSVPVVRPEVSLPRLRRFFGTEPGADSQVAAGSGYDAVLRRAQEFKAAAGQQHEPRVSLRPRIYASNDPQPAPEPVVYDEPAPDDCHEPDVVWDVQASALNVVFERARSAIDPGTDHRAETPSAPGGDVVEPYLAEDDFPVDVAEPVFSDVTYPGDIVYEADFVNHQLVPKHHAESADAIDSYEVEDAEKQYELLDAEAEPVDDIWEDDDPRDALPTKATRPQESPRSSWWRSLNFGRKRRYQADPEPDDRFDQALDPRWDAAESDEYEPDVYSERDDDAFADDQWGDASDEWYEPVAAQYEEEELDEIVEPLQPITSEDSWLEDERQFPMPQPPGWHDERTRLLAARPDHTPLPHPITFERAEVTPPVAAQADPVSEPRSPARPTRRPPAHFDLGRPDGLSAFRAALFEGSNESSPAVDVTASFTPDVVTPAIGSLRHETEAPPVTTPIPMPRGHRDRPASSGSGARYAQHRDMFDPTFDIQKTVASEEDEQQHFEVASKVAKACSTCRSFRPTEDGTHGWCMNEWASTYRQMVNADELACRSSIGDWWLAADTTWIPPVDRIVPKTPRADRLVAQADEEYSGQRDRDRRVRTRKVV